MSRPGTISACVLMVLADGKKRTAREISAEMYKGAALIASQADTIKTVLLPLVKKGLVRSQRAGRHANSPNLYWIELPSSQRVARAQEMQHASP